MPTVVSVGDILAGKYRVEKVLGVGGMGMVVAAMHIELDQRVALKFMLPDAMRSPQAVERFLREAKSAVRLRSEHVCRVLDVGKLDDGAPYIVMEFMEGHDFAELLAQRGALAVPDAVTYVLQAIEGVAEAHANQIVHRDLKPANLFITTDNGGSPLVKVLDFGISKSSIGGGATRTGDIMGSPAYMSPEQMMSSKDVDGRTDVWALGVILYQAVTGRLPFEGETMPELCMAVLNVAPRAPSELRADVPPAFSGVIMRCLDKQLAQRFPDVGALAAALAPFGWHDATAAVARVAKVLQRNAPVIVPPHGIAPTLLAAPGPSLGGPARTPGLAPTVAETGASQGAAIAAPRQVNTTLGGASGQFAAGAAALPTQARGRRRWWIVGVTAALATGGGAFALLGSGHTPATTSPLAGSAAGSSVATTGSTVATVASARPSVPPADPPAATQPATPPAAPPTPDDRPDRSKATVRKTVRAFVEWSKTHKGSPCPPTIELATLADGIDDGWGTPVSLTCTDQPENVIAGVISAGADRTFNTDDDIRSWTLDDPATAHVAGPRWQARPRTSAKPAKHAQTSTTKPVAAPASGPGSASGPTTPPGSTGSTPVAPPTTAPPTGPKPEPQLFDKNGIPIKR